MTKHKRKKGYAAGGFVKPMKSGKPSTVYSDNPKMNTAKVKPDPMDGPMVVRGYAMGGFVSPYDESVKDRLARQAEMRRQLDEEMKKRERD